MKGAERAGIETYRPRYDNYVYYYYHQHCVPQSVKLRLDRSPADELARQDKEKVQLAHIVQERAALRESLRQLRLQFARRLNVPAFMVFHNTVLDQLTAHMPQNQSEFLAIHGIGPKKYQSFGEPFLQLIHQFRTSLPQNCEKPRGSQRRARNGPAVGMDEQEENEFATVEILSCEEIVRRKFEDAESNGYVIEI